MGTSPSAAFTSSMYAVWLPRTCCPSHPWKG